jgi:ammonia channel protein AmtB
MWGAIGVGIFAVAGIGGVSGLFEGNVEQLIDQLIAVAVTVVFCSVMTFAIIKAIDLVLGLRVEESAEETGLDIAVHGETAYVPWSGTAGAIVLSESVAFGHDASASGRNLSATEAKPA